MSGGHARRRLRRLEARLWTGRVAHLLGGLLDLLEALARYRLARLRARRRGRRRYLARHFTAAGRDSAARPPRHRGA